MAAPRFRVATLARELERLAPRSVVDLGCGRGQLVEEIRRVLPQAKLTGIDLSTAQIEHNKAAMPWATWSVANLSLPLPDGLDEHDAVVATEIIEHLDDPEAFLANAARLLRPGGHLIVTTQSGRVGETERRVGHVRHFTAADVTDLLERAGLAPVRVWNAGFPFHDLSKWYANLNPDASMAAFSGKPYGLKEDLVCAALRLAFRFNSNRRGAQLFAIARRLQ
jgi:predicted TPR repeat methyltransferase